MPTRNLHGLTMCIKSGTICMIGHRKASTTIINKHGEFSGQQTANYQVRKNVHFGTIKNSSGNVTEGNIAIINVKSIRTVSSSCSIK